MSMDERMPIVIVGHVDHGKSTLIGRLLYDTDSIPQEILNEVKAVCKELGRKMEFAYLLDSLREEREQNITIDTTQIFFKGPTREYAIIDAPGHKEFLRNMITGASSAEAAVLIVAADGGVQEQTTRHAHLISMLGIKQLIVAVNKMDSVAYNEERFNAVKEDISAYLDRLGLKPSHIIPLSAASGENVAKAPGKMPWYKGKSVLGALGSFSMPEETSGQPLRFPIQDVYVIGSKRVLVGRVERGSVKNGDAIVFLPSGTESTLESIEMWNKERASASSGESIGATVKGAESVGRGEVACFGELPRVVNLFDATIFWMSDKAVVSGERLTLKCATQEIGCVIEKICCKVDSSTLEMTDKDCTSLADTEVGRVKIKTDKKIVLEGFHETEALGRFVLVRDGDTVSGGILSE